MEHKCLECGDVLTHKKTLARHIQHVHGFSYVYYLSKHGKSEKRICHCGKEFENTRYPGGPRAYGRAQVHCSSECAQIATNCRKRGMDLKEYWRLQSLGCAICGKMETAVGKRMLAIDHDHETGEIRGLLCGVCNRYRVGANTLETARRVVEYLQKGGTR